MLQMREKRKDESRRGAVVNIANRDVHVLSLWLPSILRVSLEAAEVYCRVQKEGWLVAIPLSSPHRSIKAAMTAETLAVVLVSQSMYMYVS